jgi:hypothetical protein
MKIPIDRIRGSSDTLFKEALEDKLAEWFGDPAKDYEVVFAWIDKSLREAHICVQRVVRDHEISLFFLTLFEISGTLQISEDKVVGL